MKSKSEPQIFSPSEIQPELDELEKTGIQRGAWIGFDSLRNLYSIKLGATTYLMGVPFSGKTEILFEILINLSEFHGWKHCIYSPETGKKEEILSEIIHKYIQKPVYGKNKMSDQERYVGLAWAQEHFRIIDDPDGKLKLDAFYDFVNEYEYKNNIKFQTTSIDPFNELMRDDGEKIEDFLNTRLSMVRRDAVKHNRHNFIVTHSRDIQAVIDPETKRRYFPAPLAHDFAGGQTWFRKGMGIVIAWRPPEFLRNENGENYKPNEVHIAVHKYKPKGTGSRGFTPLFYDSFQGRYYERNNYANNIFAHKETEKINNILIDFTEPNTPPF